MLKFNRLDKNVKILKDFMPFASTKFCDLSLGTKYIWRNTFLIDYAIFDDTLILKESCEDYKNAFYFPLGKNVEGALLEIENYTKQNNLPLKFCYIDNQTANFLSTRYNNVEIYSLRDWNDYFYDIEKFKTYSGKKYNGQRNHVNKFKKLYPNYSVREIENKDFPLIEEFLTDFYKGITSSLWTAVEEQKNVLDYIKNAKSIDQLSLLLEVDNKIIGISLGEIVGDTLIVHVEKANTSYSGVYPLLASEFVKKYASSGIKFLNREEDCGDMGLRISKLQYNPISIIEKNIVNVKTKFDEITENIFIKTERLTISDITDKDKTQYYNLYIDDELNKWWGYDYREDIKGIPSKDDFILLAKSLKDKKEEYSLAVRLDGVMIGELVLHNFDYYGNVEMGFRFLKDYQKNGYATESATALKEYVFNVLKAKGLRSRCFHQNKASNNLITRLSLQLEREDLTHKYFYLKNPYLS